MEEDLIQDGNYNDYIHPLAQPIYGCYGSFLWAVDAAETIGHP